MAATRLIDGLTGRASGRFAITVVGDEPEHAYNRIQLSPVLGARKRQRISVFRMRTGTGYVALRCCGALAVDVVSREVRTTTRSWAGMPGICHRFNAFVPPIPGGDAPSVHVPHLGGYLLHSGNFQSGGGAGGGVWGLRLRQHWHAQVTTSRSFIAVRG